MGYQPMVAVPSDTDRYADQEARSVSAPQSPLWHGLPARVYDSTRRTTPKKSFSSSRPSSLRLFAYSPVSSALPPPLRSPRSISPPPRIHPHHLLLHLRLRHLLQPLRNRRRLHLIL